MAFEYNTKIYLDAASGDDVTGDGSLGNPYQFFDTSPAKAAVEAGAIYQYEVIWLSSTSENITLNNSVWGTITNQPAVKFTAANSASFTGTGTLCTTTFGYNGVWFRGFKARGYSAFVNHPTFFFGSVFEECDIEDMLLGIGRASKAVFLNTILKDVAFKEVQASSSQFTMHCIENCTFTNVSVDSVTYPYIVLSPRAGSFENIGGFEEICERNLFINTDLVPRVLDNLAEDHADLTYNNYENCNGSFYDTINSVPKPLVGDLVPFDSVAAMQAEYLSVFGTPTTLYANETFNAIAYDSFGFPTDETSYIKNKHVGANRFGKSVTTPVANANYTFSVDHYVSNTLTPTPLVYEGAIDRAQFVRKIVAHIERTGSTEQLGANGEIECALEVSTDGVIYTSAGTFLSGIDSSTLEFDLCTLLPVASQNVAALAFRVSLQPQGAAFGEIKFYGVTGVYSTLFDLVGEGTQTLIEQKGVGAGFLIGANYGFEVPAVLRTYFTDTGKAAYGFAEIEAEALANANVSLVYDGVDTTQIIAVQVQTMTKLVTIYTFEK